ncbi:MAG: hypothetical protein M1357_03075 [Candidatus Marsarchaeota archaeon]|nr:hypothetical protein [Candidatus Marsarchaeota archaeon]
MNHRTLGLGLVVLGLILAVAGVFVKVKYGVVHNHINGLVLASQPAVTTNVFVTLVGVAVLYFAVHLLIADHKDPVTIMDAEMTQESEGTENE